jgi:hypothetical protein
MNQSLITRIIALMLALSGVTAATAYATPRSLTLTAANEVTGAVAGSALAAAGSSNEILIGSGTRFGPTNVCLSDKGAISTAGPPTKILVTTVLKATNTNLTGTLMPCRWDCVFTINANDLPPRIEF